MVDENVGPAFPHLLAALDTLQTRVGAALGERAGSMGVRLRGSHGRILNLLAPAGTRPSQLADGWISKQAVGMRVQELVRMGLVVVEPDPADRRAHLVRRTPEGDRIRDRTLAMADDIERELREQVGDARYEAFRSVLDELAWPFAPQLLLDRVGPSEAT
jgi:DNA-binding MarR family transcriptional regulator